MKDLKKIISMGFVCFFLTLTSSQANDPFRQMDLMIDNAFKNSFFGDFSYINNSSIKINRSEDADYKYVEILGEDISNKKIDINIKDGMISIRGETKRSSSQNGNSSNFFSTFNQSFSVPYGVRENEAIFDSKDDKIIIMFPKEKV
ncbi:MAG: hypothetical protein GY909_03550 [Oligoflexia bacterium]|nr:hypothetical protein [Oligoflexia bacterium]